MKQFFFLLLLATFVSACGGPEGQAVEASEAEAVPEASDVSAVFNVDPTASVVNWEGSKIIGDSHTGTIPVTTGQLMVSGGNIVGGKFSLDIRNITNTDMPADEGGDKLVGHLKSPDFFDTEKFPMAEFNLVQIQPATADNAEGITHNLRGNLTLKGETRSVSIPATVIMEDGQLKASTPKFTINRKDWGMNYGSDDIEGLAKDRIISNDVGLEIMLVAGK